MPPLLRLRLAAALCLVVACRPSEPAPADSAAVATADTLAADTTAADTLAGAVAGPALDSTASPAPLTAGGWGALRIGMTREAVVAAAGDDANPDAVGGPDPAACDEFRPVRAPRGLLVMVERGRLTRISLGAGATVRTDAGIGVGDSLPRVRAAAGGAAEVGPHKYQAAPAAYVTVWATPPAAPDDTAARGIVYEIGADARVARVHAGGPSIRYVEGCL